MESVNIISKTTALISNRCTHNLVSRKNYSTNIDKTRVSAQLDPSDKRVDSVNSDRKNSELCCISIINERESTDNILDIIFYI